MLNLYTEVSTKWEQIEFQEGRTQWDRESLASLHYVDTLAFSLESLPKELLFWLLSKIA